MRHHNLFTVCLASLAIPSAAQASDPAETVAAVMAADREFAAMARSDGAGPAFHHFAAEDARTIRPNADDVVGRAAMLDAYSTSGLLAWEPRGGYAGAAGDFAATYGSWAFYPGGDDSVAPVATGDYISVWRLDDGQWRFVLDGGNADAPAPAEPAE